MPQPCCASPETSVLLGPSQWPMRISCHPQHARSVAASVPRHASVSAVPRPCGPYCGHGTAPKVAHPPHANVPISCPRSVARRPATTLTQSADVIQARAWRRRRTPGLSTSASMTSDICPRPSVRSADGASKVSQWSACVQLRTNNYTTSSKRMTTATEQGQPRQGHFLLAVHACQSRVIREPASPARINDWVSHPPVRRTTRNSSHVAEIAD